MVFWFTIILTVAAVLLAANLLFQRYACLRICQIFENVPPFGVVPSTPDETARRITISTAEGHTLAGSLHSRTPKPSGLVIFCPELNGNHWMATRYCLPLIEAGCAVLAFDFRNQGESGKTEGYEPIHWVTDREMRDFDSVLQFIESDPDLSDLPLAVFGVSRGGGVALAAVARYPKIRAAIADSAFDTMTMARNFVNKFVRLIIPDWLYRILPAWHIDSSLRRACRMSERSRRVTYVRLDRECRQLEESAKVLLISGARDSYVSSPVAEALYGMFAERTPTELWHVKKAKHNMACETAPEEYADRTVEHFRHAGILPATPELTPEPEHPVSAP